MPQHSPQYLSQLNCYSSYAIMEVILLTHSCQADKITFGIVCISLSLSLPKECYVISDSLPLSLKFTSESSSSRNFQISSRRRNCLWLMEIMM